MDGENSGKHYFLNGWFGGKTHYFRKTPQLGNSNGIFSRQVCELELKNQESRKSIEDSDDWKTDGATKTCQKVIFQKRNNEKYQFLKEKHGKLRKRRPFWNPCPKKWYPRPFQDGPKNGQKRHFFASPKLFEILLLMPSKQGSFAGTCSPQPSVCEWEICMNRAIPTRLGL